MTMGILRLTKNNIIISVPPLSSSFPGDKVVINVVAVSLLWTPAALPVPVVTLWLGKDLVLMAGTALWLHNVQDPALIKATAISKINTGLQFVTLAVAIGTCQSTTGFFYWTADLAGILLLPLCYVTSCTTVASIFSYRHQMAFPGLSAGLVNTTTVPTPTTTTTTNCHPR
jgi:hypothetical protein